MKRPLTPQQRIKLRMATARAHPKLQIGGGDKKINPKPITLATVPKRGGK